MTIQSELYAELWIYVDKTERKDLALYSQSGVFDVEDSGARRSTWIGSFLPMLTGQTEGKMAPQSKASP